MLILLAGVVAVAEPSPETVRLTLRQAMDLAESANPELRLSEQGIDVARSSVTIAGQRPNPTVGVAVPIGPAERKQSLALTVPLETGGRRGARLLVAQATVREAEIARDQVRLVVLNQVRNAFVEFAVARAALDQSHQDLAFYDRLVDAAHRRYEAGDIAEAEVIRAEFEREGIKRTLYPAENRVRVALLNLNRLLGQPLGMGVEVVDDGWLFPTDARPAWDVPDLPTLLAMAKQNRPDLALTAQQRETARYQIALAEANQAPGIALQASLLYNPVTPAFTYLAGVQVELPWGSDRSGEVEQARARAQEALVREQATLVSAEYAVTLAWTNFLAARQQLRHDQDVLRPQAERVLFLAEQIYELGQGDITEVLVVGQSVQQQRQLLLADLARLHQALGELELAVNASLVGGTP